MKHQRIDFIDQVAVTTGNTEGISIVAIAMKILLGWELGAGQGHIQRLAVLARALAARGCEPVFALKQFNLRNIDFPWESMVAPYLPFSGREDSHTFADMLATFGFDQVDLLQQHIQSWHSILKTVNPALVITDHAPGLVLAASGLVPTVVLGTHFTVPPPVETFPIFRFPAPPESEVRQAQVTETVEKVVKLTGTLGQTLNGDRSFIFSLPELDDYRGWRTAPYDNYVGIHTAPMPVHSPAPGQMPWAYLANEYAHRELIIDTLYPNTEFRPLQEALQQTSMAIHHGGVATTVACTLAGIPQLILPRYYEQQLNAIALIRLGIGQMLIEPTWENLWTAQIQANTLMDNAHQLAQTLAPWNHSFMEQVVDDCMKILI